ncbi:TRAP transporter small permease [Roseibium polysiphoniae]|uniref:TRAP transporter small permease n=1 Tax=Roseibium polysiphoniae TaxID=2571221 RepID=UPI0032997289
MSNSAHQSSLTSQVANVTSRGCEVIAITAILSLFIVVAVNILMRVVFDVSGTQINLMIPGAIELASYALLIAVFASLPAALEKGLIRVDVLTVMMPKGLSEALDRFWYLVLFLFAAALAWLFTGQVAETFERGEVTQDWAVPLWIPYLIITMECVAFAVVSCAIAVNPAVIKPEAV